MKVLIIGAGNIGRRHMQGLAGVPEITGVNVVDPSAKALKVAKEMALSEQRMGKGINVHFHRTIPDGVHDVAIVATGANERRWAWDAVRDKAKHVILEKFLFNDPEQYKVPAPGSAFVNCPRRAMACYDRFRTAEKISIFYYGVDGLLCNAIHFIDLMTALTGEDEISLTVDVRKKKKSKRKGYWDGEGSVWATTKDMRGSCRLDSQTLRKNAEPLYIINDHAISEIGMEAVCPDGSIIPFHFELQSMMTGRIVLDLMRRGTCALPDYATSARTHLLFLEQLRRIGWKKPIT